MKKAAILITILSLVFLLGLTSVYAQEPIKVSIDGTTLSFDVNPTVIEGRTLVPLRAIFEALGAEIQWDDATKTVTGTKGDKTIILQVDNKYATVNGETKELEVAGTIVDGRTMVPARFIAESLDASVAWDAENRTVVITSSKTGEESAVETVPNKPEYPEAVIEDFVKYMTQIEGLEDQATKLYESTMAVNYTDDQEFYNKLTEEVVPAFTEFLATLEKIQPKTNEITQLHNMYIEATKTISDAVDLILEAIENEDESLITEADTKLDQANKLMEQWEAQSNKYSDAINTIN